MAALSLLRRVERIFLVTVFLAMVALFFLNVVTREIGGSLASQFAWIEEAVRLMNIFLVFGALGIALERGRHVSIDTVRNAMPDRYRTPVLKLIDLTGVLFSGYMAYLAWNLIIFVLQTGQRSPTLNIPMGWIYAAPVVGFSLLGLRYALSFFGIIDRFSKADEDQGDMGGEHV
ncbi:MAG: TRAP transporter small permease [Pseudomonadota bacterium]